LSPTCGWRLLVAGRDVHLREPVLILSSDEHWLGLLPSQHLSTEGRVQSPGVGDDVAALVSTRGPPRVLGAPTGLQRLAGRLRAGLRAAAGPLPGDERWQALTDRLEASEVDVLVVWEPSRATRDRRVWAALAAICEEHAVRFGCNGRVYDLTDPDDAFQLDLFFALATRESGATRKRVLRSTRASAIAGRPHGKLLYGYRRTYREGSRGPELVAQVIVDEQAAVVREAADRLMRGEPLYRIARDLNGRGVPAPRGSSWEPTQIKRLCVNPSYIAKRTHKGQIVGDALWPPILPESTYYACVSRLTDPSRRTNEGRGARVTGQVGWGNQGRPSAS